MSYRLAAAVIAAVSTSTLVLSVDRAASEEHKILLATDWVRENREPCAAAPRKQNRSNPFNPCAAKEPHESKQKDIQRERSKDSDEVWDKPVVDPCNFQTPPSYCE